ncbi:MAG: acyltransferase [Actinobacteria bacterium]|nr:acyltransferase [Actinomycetota bacterium]
MSTAARPAERRHPFDGVRALLICVVVAGHLELTDFFVGGQARVLGFFAISGFLVTSLLLKEHNRTATIDVRGFYFKRIARLFPPLVLACLLTLIASAAATNSWWPSGGVEPLFAVATIGAALSQTLVFFAASGQTLAYELVPVWSLNIDQFFYLVAAPLLAWMLRIRTRMTLAVVFAGAATASFVWSTYLTVGGASDARVAYGIDTRSGAIVLGAFAAIAVTSPSITGFLVTHARVLALGCLAAIFLLGTRAVIDTTEHMTTWAQPAFAGAIVLVLAVLWHTPTLAAPVLTSTLLVWIGLRSYGIFLFHVPVMMATGGVSENAWRNLGVIAVTLAIAAASYRWLETPVANAVRRRVKARALLSPALEVSVTNTVVDLTDQPATVTSQQR